MNVLALLIFVSSISMMVRSTQAEVSEAGISMAITVLLMSQMFYKLDAQQCIIRGEYSIRGMMLKGYTYIEEKTGIWLNCLDKCDDDIRCQSFNYVISQSICELNNRTKEARPEDFVPDSDRFYIKRFRERVPIGSVPELPAESCAEIRASEGEDAVSGNYWFDSIKPGEVVPARCDMSKLDIDDCASHPCKNNGTCTDRVNGFNCSCAPGFNGTQCEISTGCADSYKSGERKSGVYTINPDGAGIIKVFCDQTKAGGGWLVFQKRLDGSVDFYRGWTEYKRGFGSLTGEFWLGLDEIHRLTSSGRYKLRVDLEDFDGNTYYAEYDFFEVASEGEKYKLSVGSYTGLNFYVL
ncbi:ryncolin-2-like [Orbicella faveolata]|uniref:ryncolin-2-like n=1 Tax=Orbicella faveolata TaxID=48498 RepID=UPI0009E35409|nr:ryncolin-2-like [Orbicella faveolata]